MGTKIVSEVSVALRTEPYHKCQDRVVQYVEPNTKVKVLDEAMFDLLGEKEYQKVRLESGKEGYILAEALEAM